MLPKLHLSLILNLEYVDYTTLNENFFSSKNFNKFKYYTLHYSEKKDKYIIVARDKQGNELFSEYLRNTYLVETKE